MNRKKAFFITGIIFYLVFLLVYINGSYPLVGHDYRYFISRLFDTYLHYQKNGLTIQWFTPSFGGGLPAYHNPQHIQFSLTQFLVFLFNPWLASMISLAIISTIGYYAAYRFNRDIINLSWQASILGALFFISGGFYIQHMAAGQLGFILFPITSLFYYLLFSQKLPAWRSGVMIGLLAGLFFHSAGFIPLVITAFSFILLPPLIYLLAPTQLNLQKVLISGVIGAVIAAALSAGKLYAIFSFMQHFPRDLYLNTETVSPYYDSFFSALVGLSLQFTGVPFFTIPFRIFIEEKDATVQMMTALIGGQRLGPWEMDTSISPVLVFIFYLAAKKIPSKIKIWQGNRWKLHTKDKGKIASVVLLAFFSWIIFSFATTFGFVYQGTRNLPIIRSLVVNARYATAFLFPFSILGAYLFDKRLKLQKTDKQTDVFTRYFVLTLIFLLVYFLLPFDIQSRGYNLGAVQDAYSAFRSGEDMVVQQISLALDNETFINQASSRYPYEALFGYDLEQFTPKVVPGPIEMTDGEYYNMTNPNSLVYDTEELWTRFTLDEREKMLQFASYQQPKWDIPPIQHTLNAISLVSLILAILLPGGYLIWEKLKKKKQT